MSDDAVFLHGLWVPPNEVHRFTELRLYEGELDLDVWKLSISLKYCERRRVALDVGAHLGATARYMAARFERVLAFEAVERTYRYMLRNVGALGNVAALNVAAMDRRQDLYFEVLPNHSQLSHVVEPGEQRHFGSKSSLVGPVPAIPIDELALSEVDFVKIDVEGSELEVVRGMTETIARCRPIIQMETAGNEEKFHGRPMNGAAEFLTALGMEKVSDYPFERDSLFRFPGTRS